jgi:hypothetical protein
MGAPQIPIRDGIGLVAPPSTTLKDFIARRAPSLRWVILLGFDQKVGKARVNA